MTMMKRAIPVIFDTDPGIDDAMALFLLARHPDIDLRAITTAFGNASLEITTRNAQRLAAFYGLDVPIAAGAAGPLRAGAEREAPAHVHGDDGLGGMVSRLPAATRPLDPRPAHELICDLINATPGEITLLAVGPMSNLALALRHDPGIAAKVKQVVVMGGAFGMHGHSGNVTPVAEANIINDPEAADIVFTASWPVLIVGLDVTHEVVMGEDYLADLRGTSAGDFLWEATRHYQDFYHELAGIGGIYCHDATAAASIVAPGLFRVRGGPVRVVLDGIAVGQTIQDCAKPDGRQTPWSSCPPQQACIGVDAEGVLALFASLFKNGTDEQGTLTQ